MYNADIEYTSITEQEALTIIDMIANVGGTLGLFIGISLLSFLEMAEILIKIASILLKDKVKTVRTKKPKSFTVNL